MDARGVVAVQTQMALIDMCHDAAEEFGASKAADTTIVWPLSEREKAMVAYTDERGNK